MSKTGRVRLGLVLVTLLARPARAWDPDSHLAIVRGAIALSPAAEARLPVSFREDMFREVAAADLTDKTCAAHRGAQARKEPAREADRLLLALRRPGASAYYRAQMLGQYLHFVADCVVPAAIASGRQTPRVVLSRLPTWAKGGFRLVRATFSAPAAATSSAPPVTNRVPR